MAPRADQMHSQVGTLLCKGINRSWRPQGIFKVTGTFKSVGYGKIKPRGPQTVLISNLPPCNVHKIMGV